MGWQFQSSLALLVLVSLAVGMLISILASLPSAAEGEPPVGAGYGAVRVSGDRVLATEHFAGGVALSGANLMPLKRFQAVLASDEVVACEALA
mgnify:CR=1 FL=1